MMKLLPYPLRSLTGRLTSFFICFLIPGLLAANNYVVNTTNDTHALLPGSGLGLDANGDISLRSAMEAADATAGPHTIVLSSAMYTLTLGQLVFGTNGGTLTITGNGPTVTVIDMTAGAGQDRILILNPTGAADNVIVVINGVKFQNGYLTSDPYGGSAIVAGGGTGNALTLTNCAFVNNVVPAFSGPGGAINQVISGDLTIDNCSFTNNEASDGGGAVFFFVFADPTYNGNLVVRNSTFSGNTAPAGGEGGAIYFSASEQNGNNFSVSIQENNFLNNIASGLGGAIFANTSFGAAASLNVNYNRFVGNSSSLASASGLFMVGGDGSVDATNNWWGCNTGPTAAGPCDKAGSVVFGGTGVLTTSPWLQLKVNASPDVFCGSSNTNTSNITAGFLSNSNNDVIAAADLDALIGLPISFSATGGTLSGAQPTIQASGTATALFTSDGSPVATVNAVVDNVPNNDPIAQATITSDVSNPSITCPPAVTVQCAGDVPAPDVNTVTASDNSGTVTVTFEGDVISNQTCANRYTITRTYKATDGCGNSSTCTQTITVNDDTAPTISCPPDLTVSCTSAIPAHDFSGGSTGNDNCGGAVTVTWQGDVISSQTCANKYTVTRTYRATDVCGNYSECTQIITVDDNVNPVITCPPAVTVQCASQVPANNFAGGSASDNCGTVNVNWVSDVISNQSCPNRYTITRTYRASDGCNESTCTQTITVNDNTPPVLNCPNVEANPTSSNGAIVNYAPPTATDNCGSVTVNYVSGGAPGSNFPIGVTNVTWSATDACGNTSTCTFTVTVNSPSCGPNKVYVCHNGHTLCINVSSLQNHLNHGDQYGPCSWYQQGRSIVGTENIEEEIIQEVEGEDIVIEEETMVTESKSNKEAIQQVPENYKLVNYPNPFSNKTVIRYELPENAKVSIMVYDMLGRPVANLVQGEKNAGVHYREYDGSALAPGMYYCRMVAVAGGSRYLKTEKLSIIR